MACGKEFEFDPSIITSCPKCGSENIFSPNAFEANLTDFLEKEKKKLGLDKKKKL